MDFHQLHHCCWQNYFVVDGMMVVVDLLHCFHGCPKLCYQQRSQSPSYSMILERKNAMVIFGHQQQVQSLPCGHAEEVPAILGPGQPMMDVEEDNNPGPEEVHSFLLLGAYSSLDQVHPHDDPRKTNYAPDWVVMGFPLVDDVRDDEQDTDPTLQEEEVENVKNLWG